MAVLQKANEDKLFATTYMVNHTARLMLVTTKPIKPGEELLYDYGERRKEVLEEFPWLRE